MLKNEVHFKTNISTKCQKGIQNIMETKPPFLLILFSTQLFASKRGYLFPLDTYRTAIYKQLSEFCKIQNAIFRAKCSFGRRRVKCIKHFSKLGLLVVG